MNHMPSKLNADFDKPIEIDHIHGFSAYFIWGQETIGFGEFSIRIVDGEITSIDNEGMGKEWARRALYALVDKVVELGFDENGRARE